MKNHKKMLSLRNNLRNIVVNRFNFWYEVFISFIVLCHDSIRSCIKTKLRLMEWHDNPLRIFASKFIKSLAKVFRIFDVLSNVKWCHIFNIFRLRESRKRAGRYTWIFVHSIHLRSFNLRLFPPFTKHQSHVVMADFRASFQLFESFLTGRQTHLHNDNKSKEIPKPSV